MSKKINKQQRKQLIWILIVVAVVFGIFLGTYAYLQSLNRFEYAGVRWEKVKYGNLDLYQSVFPLFGSNYNMFLREDPRTNNVSLENVSFKFYPEVIVSLEPAAGSCGSATMAQINLGQFLGVAQRRVIPAVSNESVAEAMGVMYATCADAGTNRTVILVQKSETPKITQEGDCYIINVGNCENEKAMEKFLVGVVSQIYENKL